jgi:DNA-binding Lrp family transcriptional regulator
VTAAPLSPEPLDLDMLREMYRNGAVNLAGIDPRLNATRIAQRLHVGRARVAGRLKAWSESGFLARYDVWLNPALFGWQGAWLSLQVDHPRHKATLLARLALVEGAVGGLEFLGDWVSLGLVFPEPAALERTTELLRGLAGVRAVEPPAIWEVAEPRRALTPLDIRIVRALRERPTATLSETSHRVGISARTMTRRYGELVENWAVWFVPVFDFRAISYPVVSLSLLLDPGTGPADVLRRLRARFPLTLESRFQGAGPDGGAIPHVFFVMPPSAAHLEELTLLVESMEGVRSVESLLLVRVHSFPAWFDRHLASLARPSR